MTVSQDTVAQLQLNFRRQQPEEVAGTVRLNNGLLLSGICSNVNFFEASTGGKRLEMRLINQSLRKIYVSTRNCDPVVANNAVLPVHRFVIRHGRTGRRPLNLSIGIHQPPVFGPDGRAQMKLNRGNGNFTVVDLGITGLNEQYATVSALNYAHEFAISMKRLPDSALYAGKNQAGIVRLILGFDRVNTQLNVVQMLIQTEKFTAATQLLTELENDHPEEINRINDLWEQFKVAISTRALTEMTRQQELGQRKRLQTFLRRWPQAKLTPTVRVKVKDLADGLTEERTTLSDLKDSIDRNLAEIQDLAVRRLATRMQDTMWREIGIDNLDLLASYQLLSLDDTLAPESKIALALSGWMLGAESAIDDFEQTTGLFEARILVQDFLAAPAAATIERNAMLNQMRNQEGFSAERLGQMLALLPPGGELPRSTDTDPEFITLSAQEDIAAALICLPPEYNAAREYPLLIAFPEGGQSLQNTARMWQQEAARFGYIVVCPDLYSTSKSIYQASANDLIQLRGLLIYLKSQLRINDDRIFAAGHGMGSEAAIDLATSLPGMFAGVIPIAGVGRDHLLWTVRNAPDLAWFVITGSRQPVMVPRFGNLRSKLFQRDTRRRYLDVVYINYTGRGFEPYTESFEDIFSWMQLQQRSLPPKEIFAKAVRTVDRHWFWLDLEPLPDRLATMDAGGSATTKPRKTASVSAEITATGFRLKTVPSGGMLRLLQGMSVANLDKPLTIVKGSRTTKVSIQPTTRDMLEDFAKHRDRRRICLMRIPIP